MTIIFFRAETFLSQLVKKIFQHRVGIRATTIYMNYNFNVISKICEIFPIFQWSRTKGLSVCDITSHGELENSKCETETVRLELDVSKH